MKRVIAFILATTMLLCLVACSSTDTGDTTSSSEPVTTANETTQPTEDATAADKQPISGVTLSIGNLRFQLPTSMTAEKEDEHAWSITLRESKAYLVIYCSGDISDYDVWTLPAYVEGQHAGLAQSRGETQDESEISLRIAGFDASGEKYTMPNGDGPEIFNEDVSFTDTWYAYTFMFYCNGEDGNLTDYLQLYTDFLSSVQYIGAAPRNDQTSSPTLSEATTPPATEPPATNPPETTPPVTTQPAEAGPTTGEKNALKAAKNYLNLMPFSYEGLIDQLEYEGYTTAEAAYAADNCGANWNEQALKSAKTYLDLMPFSYSGLIDQLEYEKYTPAQAAYGADNCGADWYEQAARSAAKYLDLMAFSREGLISQLEYEGFTHDQAVYGVEQNGL